MNPNIPPYGQMPMQPPQRRGDIPYGQTPPHMRQQHPYQPYYMQHMPQMIPQYPQHYQQAWYPNLYQHPQYPPHAPRHMYYPQPPPQPHHYHMPQHQGPLIVSSQPQPHSSPRHGLAPAAIYQTSGQQPSSTASTTSLTQSQTPPSRSVSTASGLAAQKESTPPLTPSATNTAPSAQTPSTSSSTVREPFLAPLPWLSVPEQEFPARALRKRRTLLASNAGREFVTFPLEEIPVAEVFETVAVEHPLATAASDDVSASTPTQTPTTLASSAPSEAVSTQPTTPLSSAASQKAQLTPTQAKVARAAIPVVPVVPVLPHGSAARRDSAVSSISRPEVAAREDNDSNIEGLNKPVASPPPALTSWAALLRSQNAAATATVGASSAVANGLGASKTETLGDVLNEINANESPAHIAFLQPRGLVNTGNMCYMNSILQMLVFCVPFYEFLDRVAKRAPHTFKSDTPLIDAMILFMREFPAIDSTTSVEQLRLRLKPEDYERYGDSFIPEYVYNVIKQLPRFRDMRRGHQQDAQEFLGFLLEELHEECASAMRSGAAGNSGRSTPVGSVSNTSDIPESDGGWMEVGHKQRSAVTRSSGAAVESPINNIFGGKLRSEFKVSGNKLSVTLEPYQPLQLDIGSPQVNNILDALKGLTRPESVQGDFQSARGTKTTATKQVFIETLPPVLILHLKRFHYDSSTNRVEKIWKKVGYPLELEIPKDVFPATTRNKFASHGGLPKYRLIGVIYHHGKNANGGHYTVDIRRQDGREWVRVDDTIIRRIRSDDVAEGGSEENPKILAAALEQHKQGKGNNNRFEQIEEGEEETSNTAWSQVNGHSRSKSTMSAIVNGTATPVKDSSGPQTPRDRYSIKDNKVAYLLFYQKITN